MKLHPSSFLLKSVNEVQKKLSDKKLRVKVNIYPSIEWGCPNKIPIIGIPFVYFNPIFSEIEHDHIFTSNGGIFKILFHEVGHIVNYSFRLWEKEEWKKIFGDFNSPYPENGKLEIELDPYSKDFVRNLPDYNFCYAQIHPDESFAETFAVWISQPMNQWKQKYRDWPTLDKLLYMDRLMKELRDTKPLVTGGRKHKPLHTVKFS